jgi:hypothetical protein
MAILPHGAFWALLLVCFAGYCTGKTVTYDFNVTWVTANPDGLKERKVVGVNGEWPLPVIEVDKGDQLVVNMHNGLGDKNASIHFHGMVCQSLPFIPYPSCRVELFRNILEAVLKAWCFNLQHDPALSPKDRSRILY